LDFPRIPRDPSICFLNSLQINDEPTDPYTLKVQDLLGRMKNDGYTLSGEAAVAGLCSMVNSREFLAALDVALPEKFTRLKFLRTADDVLGAFDGPCFTSSFNRQAANNKNGKVLAQSRLQKVAKQTTKNKLIAMRKPLACHLATSFGVLLGKNAFSYMETFEAKDGEVDEAGEEKDDGEEIGQNVAEKQVEEEAEKSEQNDQTEENDQSEEEDRCADLLKERETNRYMELAE
jgi:hypothetical protein